MEMHKYTFTNGDVMTSRLNKEELMRRLGRLDTLRVLTEGFLDDEDCPGRTICKKAINAYNKMNDFTGIIRLNSLEKDWLSYMLEDGMLDDEDVECINWYIKRF